MTKDLKDKAIQIKGKSYVVVSDRVLYFNDAYKEGCIITDLVSYEGGQCVVKATVYPEGLSGRYFTGYAQEIDGSTFINKTSALENAETSAVGRALAMMGIGVIDSIASVDEINKATNRPEEDEKPWFNQKELDELDSLIPTMSKDEMEAYIKDIKEAYRFSKAMGQKVKDLLDNIK